jgi:hypothetical protein
MTTEIKKCGCNMGGYFSSSQFEHFSISDVPEMLMALTAFYYNNQGEARDPDGSDRSESEHYRAMEDHIKIGGTSSD